MVELLRRNPLQYRAHGRFRRLAELPSLARACLGEPDYYETLIVIVASTFDPTPPPNWVAAVFLPERWMFGF